MVPKPYDVEVLSRKERLRHNGHYIYFEEVRLGHDGIERVYGYSLDSAVYMLNVDHVIGKLKAKGKVE